MRFLFCIIKWHVMALYVVLGGALRCTLEGGAVESVERDEQV